MKAIQIILATFMVSAPTMAQSVTGVGAGSVPSTPTVTIGVKGDPGPRGKRGVSGQHGPQGRPGATRVITRQVLVPVYGQLGHLEGVGHGPIYREVKTWNPASTSYVDAKINQKKNRASLIWLAAGIVIVVGGGLIVYLPTIRR